MEGREWVYENGLLKAREIEEIKESIRRASSRNLEEQQIKAFARFIRSL
jgi:hypothetical protein